MDKPALVVTYTDGPVQRFQVAVFEPINSSLISTSEEDTYDKFILSLPKNDADTLRGILAISRKGDT